MQEYKFSCHRCEPGEVGDGIKQPVVVVGFEASVDHMSEKHGQFATPDKQFQVHTSFKISKGKYLILSHIDITISLIKIFLYSVFGAIVFSHAKII